MIKEKKRKLRGSVLLTVVCVMSLLIVFLFGTLTLATAANNRAHVNYSTAQTGVTSRTVVDAAIKAMEANTTFGNAVSELELGKGAGFTVNVELGAVPEAGRYGHINPVSIQPVGKKQFYDYDKKEWIDGDIIRFSSTVSMAGVDSTTSAYIVKQPPGTGDGTGGGGAGFVTTAGADLSCQTNLYGGSYISLPKLADAKKYIYAYRTKENGSDEEYENWASDTTIYRQFSTYNPSDDKSAFVLNNSGALAEADLYVNNNMYVENWSGFVFPDKGKGITVWGDMYLHNNVGSHLKYVFNNVDSSQIKFSEIPYVYVDGTVSGGAIVFGGAGDSVNPLNIFCGSIEADNIASGNVKITGDLYLMNPNKTSILKPDSSTTLYKWTGSVINHTGAEEEHKTSNIYSKGNLILGNMNVSGDVRVEGDCTIGAGVTITGDLVVGGTLNIDNNAVVNGTIYYNPENNSFTNKEPLKKEDVAKQNIIDHAKQSVPRDNVIEFENIKRYYYEYKPSEHELNEFGQWVDLFGNAVSDPNQPYYYVWKEDKNPDDLAVAETEAAENGTTVNYTEFFQNPYIGYNSCPQAIESKDWNVDYYYVETDVIDNGDGTYSTTAKSKRVYEKTFMYDEESGTKFDADDNSYLIEIEAFKSVPDKDGNERNPILKVKDLDSALGYGDSPNQVFINKNTNEVISKYDGENIEKDIIPAKREYKKITDDDSEYKNQKIYPENAERNVILGIDTIDGVDKSDTQIIKTIEEVLDKVADPYKHSSIPAEKIEEAKNERYGSIYDIFDKNGKIAYMLNSNGSYESLDIKKVGTGSSMSDYRVVINGEDKTLDEMASHYGSGNKKIAPVITKSCILNLGLANGDCDGLVIDPEGKEIYIVVEKLDLGSGINILVNDSNPGSVVNFYINNNDGSASQFNIGGGWLGTTNYCKALSESSGKGVIRYASGTGGTDDLILDKLGKPRVNIYGGKDSKLEVSNTQFLIANILSPYLEVSISATSSLPYSYDEVYYDGVDINNLSGESAKIKQLLIGCLNAKEVSIPNQMSVLYVTDSESDPPKHSGDGENAFNYRILYYDEY